MQVKRWQALSSNPNEGEQQLFDSDWQFADADNYNGEGPSCTTEQNELAPATSYRDLLDPIPDAAPLLKSDNARRAEAQRLRVAEVSVKVGHGHPRHHHHVVVVRHPHHHHTTVIHHD